MEMARRTITLLRNRSVPISVDLGERLVVLSPLGSRRTKMEQWTFGQSHLGDEVLARVPTARVLPIEYPVGEAARGSVQRALSGAQVIVVGLLNAIVDSDQVEFTTWLRDEAPQAALIGVGLRTPYDVLALPWLESYACAYSSVEPSVSALVEVLFGEQPARGRLPVRLVPAESGHAERG